MHNIFLLRHDSEKNLTANLTALLIFATSFWYVKMMWYKNIYHRSSKIGWTWFSQQGQFTISSLFVYFVILFWDVLERFNWKEPSTWNTRQDRKNKGKCLEFYVTICYKTKTCKLIIFIWWNRKTLSYYRISLHLYGQKRIMLCKIFRFRLWYYKINKLVSIEMRKGLFKCNLFL